MPNIGAFHVPPDNTNQLEDSVSIYERTTENKWDKKKHSCKFCKKMVTKMSTHLRLCHRSESEVAYVLAMKKESKERRVAWGKILNEGDYNYNFCNTFD